MKKILIIGGSGTISSAITRMLVHNNDVDLYVLNRGLKKSIIYDNVKYLRGDIKNPKNIKRVLKDYFFDIVINFVVMDISDARINYDIFKDKTDLFVFISTVCVLNGIKSCMISENSSYGNSYSEYGRNKEECEKYFIRKHKSNGFPVAIIRPSQTYSNDRIPLSVKGNSCWSVIDRMINNKKVIIHGDGQSVWASTHSDDFAVIFCDLLLNNDINGEIYQIVNNRIHTWDEVYLTLARLLKVEYKPVYITSDILGLSKQYNLDKSINGDKRWSKVFDNEKLNKVVKVHCEVSLESDLKRYLDYMDKHPDLKIKDESFDLWCDNTITLYENLISEIKEKI